MGREPGPHRPRRARPAAAVLGVALAAGAAGCGVGAQSAPQALDIPTPRGATGPGAISVSPGVLAPWVSVPVKIYLVGGDKRVTAVERQVASPASVSSALNQLALGPTQGEQDRGLVSPASMVSPFGVGRVVAGVVRVDLPESFQDLDGLDQTMAVAQIVFTATSVHGVRAVRFYVAGQAAQVPEANGHLVGGPSTRADYRALGP
jgi:spore germination protein GerM